MVAAAAAEDFDLVVSPHFLDEGPDGPSFSFDSLNNTEPGRLP